MARRRIFCFSVCITLCILPSLQQTPRCGTVLPHTEDQFVGRVSGGDDAEKRTWPWQVSLQKDDKYWCGGVLIDAQHVLTVAHRVQESTSDNTQVARSRSFTNPSRFKVLLGLHDTYKVTKATVVNVQSITVHPQFNRFTNNIAILKLASPVQFQSKINAICLPENDAQSGERCAITGWGERGNNGDLTSRNVLQQAFVSIVSSSDCKQSSVWGSNIDDTMLCAGGQGADACFGDGGGPLACNSTGKWELQGLVSWGARCGSADNKPGVYTNVKTLKSWILANIGGGGSEGGRLGTDEPLPPASPAPARPTSIDADGRSGRGGHRVYDSSEEAA